MLFRDFRSSTHSGVEPVPAWEAYFYPSCEKYVFFDRCFSPKSANDYSRVGVPRSNAGHIFNLAIAKGVRDGCRSESCTRWVWCTMTDISPAVQRAPFGTPTRREQ